MSNPSRRAPRSTRRRARPRLTTGASVDALLAAFARCRTPEGRARVGAALATAGVNDDRIRAALVGMLEDDPLNGAAYLSALGDRRALGDLSRTVDRLVASPIGDCEICQAEHLIAVATAVKVLGGALSDAQLERIERVAERAAERWIPLDDHCSSRRPTAVAGREPAPDGDEKRRLH